MQKKRSRNMKISPQYIAGFLDGEGSISIVKVSRERGRYRCSVCLSNNNLGILQEIQKGYGGRIGLWGGRCYRLVFPRKKEQLSLLKDIHPYLRIKKGRGELAILFHLCYDPNKGKRIPDEVMRLRRRFWKEMRRLNKYKSVSNTEW